LTKRVTEAAQVLGLSNLLDRQPRHLSGGEQQRVALGRAWVAQAAVWLLDEPLAHLDSRLRAEIRAELHLLRDRSGATMIEVTHDPVEALSLGQRLAVMRDGMVEQVGPPAELYDRPRSRTVATALGGPPMNLADAVVAGVDGRLALRTPVGWALPLPPGRAVEPGRAVTVGVRPEHIMAQAARDGGGSELVPLGDWAVTRAELRGPAWLLTVARPGLSWQVWWPEKPAAEVLPLAVPADVFYLFDGGTGEIDTPRPESSRGALGG
jgi:ABC-type sugar transport system ATPase subunit